MRKMRNGDDVVTVREHFNTKAFWEYYITTKYPENSRIQEAVVSGYETELGDVDMEEIKPYIITQTKELGAIMPAPGWDWE